MEEWKAAIDGADYLLDTQIIDSGIYKIGGYWETTAPPCYALFFALWVDAEAAQGLAQLSFNPIFRLEDLKDEIYALPDDAFKNPKAAEGQRKALLNEIDAVINQVKYGTYTGAISMLENDVKGKIEKWIKPGPATPLIEKADLIISILQALT